MRLTASAEQYISGCASVVVSDVDLPDLLIESIVTPADATTESLASVTYRMANKGIWEAVSANANPDIGQPGSWLQRVFLSGDPYIGNDTLIGQYLYMGTMSVDQWIEPTISAWMPLKVGQYWVVVQTDVSGTVSEGVETNNISISSQPINVYPAYTATVTAGIDAAPAGTAVPLSGYARNRQGQPAPHALVNLHITVRGISRVISAIADENGHYNTTFTPLPTEGGRYSVGVCHPGVATTDVQDEFTLYGLRVEPPKATVTVIEGGSVDGSFTIRNMSNVSLSGLSIAIADNPDNLDVELTPPASSDLAGDATAAFSFHIVAKDASVTSGTVTLRVTTAEASTVDVPIEFTVTPLVPNIVCDAGHVYSVMVRGQSRIVDVTIRNTGGRETGPIEVLFSEASWLSLTGDAAMPSLAPANQLLFLCC